MISETKLTQLGLTACTLHKKLITGYTRNRSNCKQIIIGSVWPLRQNWPNLTSQPVHYTKTSVQATPQTGHLGMEGAAGGWIGLLWQELDLPFTFHGWLCVCVCVVAASSLWVWLLSVAPVALLCHHHHQRHHPAFMALRDEALMRKRK